MISNIIDCTQDKLTLCFFSIPDLDADLANAAVVRALKVQ